MLIEERLSVFMEQLPELPEEKLLWAAVVEMREILRTNPTIDVNCRDSSSYRHTPLHLASFYASIVSLLLAHPNIDVNRKDDNGRTPFFYAGREGMTSFRLLLKDPRTNLNQPDNAGYTPLWCPAHHGLIDVIKWWIASGREMNLGKPGEYKSDAIAAATAPWWEKDLLPLLVRYKENPEQTRDEVRVELAWYDEVAAEVFALVVFVSDDLLKSKKMTRPTPPGSSRLPEDCRWSFK